MAGRFIPFPRDGFTVDRDELSGYRLGMPRTEDVEFFARRADCVRITGCMRDLHGKMAVSARVDTAAHRQSNMCTFMTPCVMNLSRSGLFEGSTFPIMSSTYRAVDHGWLPPGAGN
jgi:hypothetical protein